MIKNFWTKEEDLKLSKLVSQNIGRNNWVSISKEFKERTSGACRHRWTDYILKNSKRGKANKEKSIIVDTDCTNKERKEKRS